MQLFPFTKSETRSLEDPKVSLNSEEAWTHFFKGAGDSISEEKAMSITAVFQSLNAIGNAVSQIPLHLYEQNADGDKEKAQANPLYRILHDRPNNIHSAPHFWKWAATRIALRGRAIALIVRTKGGKVSALIPLDTAKVKVTTEIANGNLKRTYIYDEKKRYDSSEILDFCMMPNADASAHYDPLNTHGRTLNAIIAVETYGADMFADGGVPPLVMSLPAGSSPAGAERGSNEVQKYLSMAKNASRKVLPAPAGVDIRAIGFDAQKSQMIELRKLQIAEISRVMNVAPAILFDLSNGTYSNYEQQALSFVQNTITPIVKLFEAEMNEKLFADRNKKNHVEFDVNGLLRGDIKTRVEALRGGVASGIYTINEARAKENLPPVEGGDVNLVQGATLPLPMVADGGFLKKDEPASDESDDEPDADTSDDEGADDK